MGFWDDAWKGVKDAGAYAATGGILNSSGEVSFGMGPGGAATSEAAKAVGAPHTWFDISPKSPGAPQIDPAMANPFGGEVPTVSAPAFGAEPGAGDAAGLNMMKPGSIEQFYTDNADSFTAPTTTGATFQSYHPELMGPGAAEDYAATVSGKYASGTPQVSQNAQDAYTQFQSNRPDLALDSGMGAYYDNAGRIASEKIRREMAARGAYGSSASGDMVTEALTNLAADQARSEADYRLRRADTIRGFGETAGSLARGADISSAAASQNELDWMMGLGDQNQAAQAAELERIRTGLNGASAADAAWLEKILGGASVADRAQGANRQRGQDFFNNNLLLSEMLARTLGGAYEGMFDADQALLDAGMGMELGRSTENLNQDYRRSEQTEDSFWKLYDAVSSSGGGPGAVKNVTG